MLVCRAVLGTSWISHTELPEILFSASGGIFSPFRFQSSDSLSHWCPCCCSPTEQSRASLFVLRGSLRGMVVVVVESPFLVKAAAQEGAMEMGVIHSFCFKYVRGKGLKTDFHIPYATELFYLYASLRKTGKSKNTKHLQMVEKNPESLFWCWFSIKPEVFLGTKGLDPPRFMFLNPIWLSWQFNES